MRDFNAQNLANIAWALATAGEPALAVLDPFSVLEELEAHGAKAKLEDYQMSMECLVAKGQIVTGFALLLRAEASGLLRRGEENCYPMFRTLLEACRRAGDSRAASQVQAVVEQLGFSALGPVAVVL